MLGYYSQTIIHPPLTIHCYKIIIQPTPLNPPLTIPFYLPPNYHHQIIIWLASFDHYCRSTTRQPFLDNHLATPSQTIDITFNISNNIDGCHHLYDWCIHVDIYGHIYGWCSLLTHAIYKANPCWWLTLSLTFESILYNACLLYWINSFPNYEEGHHFFLPHLSANHSSIGLAKLIFIQTIIFF